MNAPSPACPFCSSAPPEAAVFCPACGARLDSERLARDAFPPLEALLERARAHPRRALFLRQGPRREDSLREVRGLLFPFALLGPAFAESPASPFGFVLRPRVLVCDARLDHLPSFLPLLEETARAAVPLAIFCENVGGDLLKTLVVNQERKTLTTFPLTPVQAGAASLELGPVARAANTQVLKGPPPALTACGAFDELWASPTATFHPQNDGPDAVHLIEAGGRTVLEARAKFHRALVHLTP